MAEFTESQRDFLDRNLLGVLATSRRDGSPQVSTIYFSRVGDLLYVGTTKASAKFQNAGRHPAVALVVNEGPAQIVVYGTAEQLTEDPERVDRYRDHRADTGRKGSEFGTPPGGDAFAAELDQAGSGLLRITPTSVLGGE